MEGRKEAAYGRSWRLWRSSDAHRNLSRQDLLRESRSWRYSRRKILRPDEFSGLTTPPWGVPLDLSIRVPSSISIGAVSHLSMYSKLHLHFTCLRTARNNSVWSMLSKRPRISNSSTKSYCQHRLRVTPTASIADLLGRYP